LERKYDEMVRSDNVFKKSAVAKKRVKGAVNEVRFSSDGKYLAASDEKGYIYNFSTDDWSIIKSIRALSSDIYIHLHFHRI